MEEIELEMIDYGVEELFAEEENITMYAPFNEFGAIQKHLESKNYEIVSAEFERIPTDVKKITPEQQADLDTLIEKIEENEDVQKVYTNAELCA